MTDATDLWTAVTTSYDAEGLLTLSNIRDPSATSADASVGADAAQGVIDLWPAYAQVAYDGTNALHVEVAKRAVIAMLWTRGGTSSTIAKVEWDEVFSDSGLIARVRRTGARGRQGPSSNSGVTQRAETVNGRRVRGWSDADSMPVNFLPSRKIADDYQ